MASFALAARTRGPLVAIGSLIFVGSDTLIGVGRFLGGFPGIDYLIWASTRSRRSHRGRGFP